MTTILDCEAEMAHRQRMMLDCSTQSGHGEATLVISARVHAIAYGMAWARLIAGRDGTDHALAVVERTARRR